MNDQSIKEFQRLFEKEFSEKLSFRDAEKIARMLLDVFLAITQTINENSDLLENCK